MADMNNETPSILITGTGSAEQITNSGASVTIDGGAGDDTISNSSENVSINGGAGDDSIELINDAAVTIKVTDGNDTISIGNGVTKFTVQDFAAGDVIKFGYEIDNLSTTEGGIVVDAVTISGLTASSITSTWSPTSGVVKYIESHSAGATLSEDKKNLEYIAAGSSTLFSISGIGSTAGLNVDTENKLVTVSAAALNKQNVTISGDYTLVLADDIYPSEVKDIWVQSGSTYSYKINSTVAGYEFADNKITYTSSVAGTTKLELTGIDISEGKAPSVSGSTVTLSKDTFSGNVSVKSNADEYSFELSEGDYSNKFFQGSSGNDTIIAKATSLNITAGNGADYVSLGTSGSKISVNAGAGNDTIVNFAEGATLFGGEAADSIDNTADKVSINGGAGNDEISLNGGTDITINVNEGNDTIFVVSGSNEFLVQNFGAGDVIQLSAAVDALETISGGVMAGEVKIKGLTLSNATPKWSVSGSNARYSEDYSAGAFLSEDKNLIVYKTATTEGGLFVISGINSTVGLDVDRENKIITVEQTALGTSNVSINNNNYTLKLADDIYPAEVKDIWVQSGSTYSYKINSTVAGYEFADNKITYTPSVAGTTKLELTGIDISEGKAPSVSGSTVTLSKDTFSGNVSVKSNAGEYSFELSEGDYSNKTFSGTANVDNIINNGSAISINGAAGNDLIDSSGSNVTITGGAGNDSIHTNQEASEVKVFGEEGSDTLENDASIATLDGGKGDDSIANWGSKVSINGGAGDDTIALNVGTEVTVKVSEGNDTIFVGDNVNEFTVQDFAAGDVIQLAYTVDKLSSIQGGTVADDVMLKGLSASSITPKWTSVSSGSWQYSESHSAGATLDVDGKTITYTAAGSENFFTISGITSTVGLDIDTETETVTLSKPALGTSNVSISGDYTLKLAEGIDDSQVADIWVQADTNYVYKINSTLAGYNEGIDKITYTPSVGGETMVEMSGIKITGTNAPSVLGSTVTLSKDTFSGNVSVKSNAGEYNFELSTGNYSSKTFSGTANADSIINNGSAISINGSAGKDYIHNESGTSKVTLLGGAGSDTLENDAETATLDGGADNDSIGNWGNKVSISGGAGNDSITNSGASVSIDGGAGNDFISNSGNNVSILGGAGNDTIENIGEKILVQYSGGNDLISGFTSSDTLQIVSGSIASAYSDGIDVFLTVGENTVTLKDLSTSTNKINLKNSAGSVSTYTVSLLKGTTQADNISNSNSNLTIQTFAGNDTLYNLGNNVTISGEAGNDNISNSGSNVSINGEAGNDIINILGGTGSTINVSAGNDTINVGKVATKFQVQGFSSQDAIVLSDTVSSLGTISGGIKADKVTITGVTASKAIPNWTLSGGSLIYREKNSAGVALADDDKSIVYRTETAEKALFTLSGVTSTVGVALDDKTVVLSAAALNKKTVTINNDYELSLGANVTEPETLAQGWAKVGNNYVYKTDSTLAGYEVAGVNTINYVEADGGKVLVQLSGVTITDGNEPFVSGNKVELSSDHFANNVSVAANANNYSFEFNQGDYSGKTFTATSKADAVQNYGSSLIIVSGADSDTLENDGSKVTLNAGAGNDSIFNRGENTSIFGGVGVDTIENYGDSATIASGADNDSIYNRGDFVSISGGAGNDSIENLGINVTISSGEGNDYINNTNSENVLVQYLGGNDLISGFTSSDTLQIVSGSIASAYSDGIDVFLTVGENTVTLKDLSTSTNKLSLMNSKGSVSEYIVPLLKGTAQADDIQNNNSNLTIEAYAGNDSITNTGVNVTISAGEGNDYVHNERDASKVSIMGGAGSDTLENDGSQVTIQGGAGNDSIGNWGDNVSINGGAGNDSIELAGGTGVTIDVKDGNDTISVSNVITSLNVQNFSAGDAIKLSSPAENLSSIKNGVVADDVTITGLTASKITPTWSLSGGVAKYSEKYTAGVRLSQDNSSILYTAPGESSLFTISGIASTVGITIDDNLVTLAKSALGTSDVSISGEYILQFAEDVDDTQTVSASWNTSGTIAIYKDDSTLDGYRFEGNKIKYVAGKEGATLIKMSGVSISEDETDGIIQGNSIMLARKNFASNVSIESNAQGYDFDIAEGNYSSKSFNATSSAEYVINNGSKIILNMGAGKDSIINSGSNVTINGAAGNDSINSGTEAQRVRINAGAGSDIVENYSDNSSIYGGAGKDSITNAASKVKIDAGDDNDFIYNNNGYVYNTLNGGAGNDSIENWGVSVLINGGAGNDSIYNIGDDATINPGKGNDTVELLLSTYDKVLLQYSSGDGDDIVTLNSSTNISVDLLSGSIGGYSSIEEDLVVQVDDGSLTFKNAVNSTVSLKTSSNENYIWNGDSNISLEANEGTYNIDNKGSYVSIKSGSGDDSITISGNEFSWNNTFVYSADGSNDVLYNFSEGDTIKIADDSKVKVKIKNDDVVLKVGDGSITLKDAAANNTKVAIVNLDDELISEEVYSTAGIISNDELIELWRDFSGTYTATEMISTIDGSKVVGKMRVIGNEFYTNSIVGGMRSDTLEGAISNDTLTGGKGSDVFVYTGGADVISDYAKQDRLSLGSDFSIVDYTLDESDLTLNFGSYDSLTINKGVGKTISFLEGRKKTSKIYTKEGIFDSRKKSVELTDVESFDANNYSKLVTIDASPATNYIEIAGNKKKNVIYASGFGSTLNGGKGKDTLISGEGADVFVYENKGGKDVIEGYDALDKIRIGDGVTIKEVKIKKGNAVIKFNKGSLTVNDTTEFTLTSATGMDTLFSDDVFIDQTNSAVKVQSTFKGSIDLSKYNSLTTADASLAKKKISLKGTSLNDTLLGGKGKDTLLGGAGADSLVGGKGKDILRGEAGNDTLVGGKGDDSLWGGNGSDNFIFTAGDGNDTIFDYTKDDMLILLNNRGKETDYNSATFNAGSGMLTLTVKGGGTLSLANVTSSTRFNINGNEYHVSGTKLVK